jgi:membrane fusion protein, multidrug efflux system
MNRKKKLVLSVSALGLSVLVIWAVISWSVSFRSINTDNAYVHADITAIAPKVAGYVTESPVADNAPVKAGELLFAIDERDYVAKVEQASANMKAAEAAVANAEAAIRLQEAVVRQAEAQVASAAATQKRASQEYARQSRLRKEKATTEQKYEDSLRDKNQTDAALAGSEANRDVQTRQLDVLAAQLSSAQAGLAQTEAVLALARLDLEHCRVFAPADGVVGNRKVRVGRYVAPGTALLDLVPVQDVWIVANFKETQLEHIRVGQSVEIVADGYPDTVLSGVVDSLAPGSGSAFSLIPPDNATGNFVRVVQRVPVKITLKENTLRGLLVPGLSVRVTVATE